LSLIQPLVCETVTSNTNVLELCNEEDPPSNKLTQGIYDFFGKTYNMKIIENVDNLFEA